MSEPRPTYGGQAVLEGVMIRGQHYVSVAVRAPSDEILIKSTPIGGLFTGKLRTLPLIRGFVALIETLYIGMSALSYSAGVAAEQDDQELNRWSMLAMISFSVLIAIVLFFLLPLFASKPFEGITESSLIPNFAEGAIRLLVFLAYVIGIGFMTDIRRVYMYHGAEHMTVHAMENGDPLDIENIRKYPTAHPRCGTAFLLTVMIVAIFVFSLVPREPLWWLILSRIILIPVIASLSYEVIRFNGRHSSNLFVQWLTAPSLWLQGLTTKQPKDDQIQVAVSAMNAAIASDQDNEPGYSS